jgi:2-polyprenyl-3-methyl-5-hydroxy-6-metoxy-1,4-benzoquinol methylase
MRCKLCGELVDPAAHVRWRKDGHTILRCPECGLLFRESLPATTELETIYDVSYFKAAEDSSGTGYLDYVADEELHRAAARRRLDILDRAAPRRGRLMDIGAAAGFFVAEAADRGWDSRGLDVSEAMVSLGRTRISAAVELGTLQSSTIPDASLDALTMWDYIEHSLDPIDDVRRARVALKPGGLLALSTGDAATFVARVSGSRWHLLTPEHHNYFFTASTLRRLLESNGFRVVSLDHCGSRYPLRYLVHKLRTLGPSTRLDRLSERLERTRVGAVAVPVNLWDIATVLARAS